MRRQRTLVGDWGHFESDAVADEAGDNDRVSVQGVDRAYSGGCQQKGVDDPLVVPNGLVLLYSSVENKRNVLIRPTRVVPLKNLVAQLEQTPVVGVSLEVEAFD